MQTGVEKLSIFNIHKYIQESVFGVIQFHTLWAMLLLLGFKKWEYRPHHLNDWALGRWLLVAETKTSLGEHKPRILGAVKFGRSEKLDKNNQQYFNPLWGWEAKWQFGYHVEDVVIFKNTLEIINDVDSQSWRTPGNQLKSNAKDGHIHELIQDGIIVRNEFTICKSNVTALCMTAIADSKLDFKTKKILNKHCEAVMKERGHF